VLYGSGHEIPASASAYAALFVDVYAQALGEWARPIVLVAAFTTMISTTLTVTDGLPRALEGAIGRLRTEEDPSAPMNRPIYAIAMVVVTLGGLTIIHQLSANLKALVDFATTVSFVVAPVLAVMNLRAITDEAVVPADREATLAVNYFFAGHNNKLTADVSRLQSRIGNGGEDDGWRVRAQWDVSF